MEILTSRFGVVQFDKEDVIDFPEGILGFGHARKYILVEDPVDEVFIWLQSCDFPEIAFPILEPEFFADNFTVTLNRHELEALNLESADKGRVFTIITIPESPTQMTANLKAPIVVNVEKRLARQCVLQDNDLAIREPIFKKLQSRVVQAAGTAVGLPKREGDVFVRLPEPAQSPEV